jgi:preprotein translocase subunit SecA
MFSFLKNFFLSHNEKVLNEYRNLLLKINYFENNIKNYSNQELKDKFLTLEKGKPDDILPEVYSIVKEVSFRTIGLKHYDVQVLGGIALYKCKISEIATGEGKTLVATLPACLFALKKNKVHIVTVNDYLAKRDTLWMKPIYDFLGLSVSTIYSNMSTDEKKRAYESDILYGTSSEFGFDYLRDNLVYNKSDKVQKNLFYAIIDEVDSILIDEARTPLIISSSQKTDVRFYKNINKLIRNLIIYDSQKKSGDFILDEKNKQILLTDDGFLKIEVLLKNNKLLNETHELYNIENIELLHSIYAALKAKYFFIKDVHYIVKNNEILIIDENTGRVMSDRRWSDGIHQALEVKEKVDIKSENVPIASITFQNYFRLYNHISGMTGTAYTESEEFNNIYGLEVIVIPSNKPNIRLDYPDFVFIKKEIKYNFVLKDIKSRFLKGQPVLVGTVSVEVSEYLSKLLKKENIPHNVLNAKYHEMESEIISKAGNLYSVTIATNMAGRGTDIVLGSKNSINYDKIVMLGGLHIIGTERHESRRIDNQLRGRSGRQGDPGSSRFYISLEDDLIRIFVGDKFFILLKKFNISDTEIISHSFINKSIENAQKKVENYNFEIRKQLLEFDDIINEQRVFIYKYRNIFIFSDDISNIFKSIFLEVIESFFDKYNDNNNNDIFKLLSIFVLEFGLEKVININNFINKESIKIDLYNYLCEYYFYKINSSLGLYIKNLEKVLLLNIIDTKWKDHLGLIYNLRTGIHLRGYANKDPKQEYKHESFILFKEMLCSVKTEFFILFFRFLSSNLNFNNNIKSNSKEKIYSYKKDEFVSIKNNTNSKDSMCYCNSGKKYKYCHGKIRG